MNRRLVAWLVAAVAVLPLGACGRGPISLALAPPGLAQEKFQQCLRDNNAYDDKTLTDPIAVNADLIASLYKRPLQPYLYDETKKDFVRDTAQPPAQPSALLGYLNCLLGRANDANASAQHFRGHVLLTLMAQYGNELIRVSRIDRQPAQALRLISHLREAELLLVAGTDALAPPDAVAAHLNQFWFAARIASMLQVAIDLEGIYAQRSLDVASNLVAALSSGPAAATHAQQLLNQAGQGLALTAKSQLYGAAFITDSRDSLIDIGAMQPTSDATKVAAEWRVWSARLDAACADLAGTAKLSDSSCRPAQAAVVALRTKMGGVEWLKDTPPVPATR